MQKTRAALINQLADAITALRATEPTLVAIDGRSAAGKTTLADDLAVHVRAQGRPVLRSSIDDFHPPGHKYRSSQRPYTPATYYAEGYDYAAFRRLVLDPLRPGGDRRCRLAHWDSFNDLAVPEAWIAAPRNVIMIVDGIFLLSPDLRQYWDYTIWLQIDWETMIERAANRDVAWVGSAETVINQYRTFWIAMHEHYETAINPARFANVIVDNRQPEAPVIIDGL